MSQPEITVPPDLPDDPELAYLMGFRDSADLFADTALSLASSVDREIDEDETAWHAEQSDAENPCPDCGEPMMHNPAGDDLCMECN